MGAEAKTKRMDSKESLSHTRDMRGEYDSSFRLSAKAQAELKYEQTIVEGVKVLYLKLLHRVEAAVGLGRFESFAEV